VSVVFPYSFFLSLFQSLFYTFFIHLTNLHLKSLLAPGSSSASNSSAYEHHPHLPHLMPSNPSPHGATPDTNYSLFDRADEDEPSKSVDPIETHGSPRKRSTPRKSSRTGRALPFLVGNIFSPSIHEVHDFNDGGEALDVGKI